MFQVPARQKHPLLDELSIIVGRENIIDEDDELIPYTKDASPFPTISPRVVVKPASVEEMAQLVKLANKHRNPIRSRGGGISITGIPQPRSENTIIIDTRRLNHVLDIDEANMTATAECGIIMGDLEKQVADRGLFLQSVNVPLHFVTLGGVLSGVVGGGIPPKSPIYGTGTNFLFGLKVVLPNGSILRTNAGGANLHQRSDFIKGGNGPDITSLFVGDGGIFGIKTEATVRVFPEAQPWDVGTCSFSEFSKAWKALSRLVRLQPFPYSQIRVSDGEKLELGFLVEGANQERIRSSINIIETICKEEGGFVGEEAEKQITRKLLDLSEMRLEKFVRSPRILVAVYSSNRDFPRVYPEIKNFVLSEIASKHLDRFGGKNFIAFIPLLQNATYFLFSLEYDPNSEESKKAILTLGKQCYQKAVELGCCPEPHQGFGAEIMSKAWSKEYRDFVIGMKKNLDPNMILNSEVWSI